MACSDTTGVFENYFKPVVSSLIYSSLAPSTLEVYQRGLALFQEFRLKFALADIFPIPLIDLLSFIAYLFQQNLSHSTISCYVAGLGFFSKVNSYEDMSQKFVVRKLLEGIKRSRPKRSDVRLPITRDMLKAIITSLSCVCKSQYELCLFRAAFSLAFHGLFRIGELAVSNNIQTHTLLNSNIAIFDGFLKIDIISSKTDQARSGTTVFIHSANDLSICPVHLVKDFIKSRPPVSGPLFCHFDGSPLSRNQFVTLLKKSLSMSGIPNNRYSSHSFRIGMATTLSAEGVSDGEIMRLGRWRSNAYKSYIRH